MWVDCHAWSLWVEAQSTAGDLWQWHGIGISKFARCNGRHRHQGKESLSLQLQSDCWFHLYKEITLDRQWRSRKVPWYCCRKLSYLPHRWSVTAKGADVCSSPSPYREASVQIKASLYLVTQPVCTCHSKDVLWGTKRGGFDKNNPV